MKIFAVLILAVVAVNAHVRFENNDITSRNGDTFSVSTDGCGGTTTYGAAGVNDVTAGDELTYTFNYGTGTNGDHANAGNTFTGYWLCADDTADLSAAGLLANAETIGNTVTSPGGSQPGGYTMTFTIPDDAEGACTYQVLDQRQWGGCQDYNVAPKPEPESSEDGASGKKGSGMSGGAIAGILIGVAVVGGAGAFFAYQRSQEGMTSGYGAGSNFASNTYNNAAPSSFGGASAPNSYAPNSYAPSSQAPSSYAPSSYNSGPSSYNNGPSSYNAGPSSYNAGPPSYGQAAPQKSWNQAPRY